VFTELGILMKSLCLWMIVSMMAVAAEPVTSGVPVGKRPGPYSFLVATGPERGQPTCYICDQDMKPTVVVFARSLTPSLGKLLVKIDDVAVQQAESGFKAWMTLLTPKADLDALAKWSQAEGLKMPVGAFEDADGPPAYGLHKDAEVTVMVFTKKSVTANYALRAGELTGTTIAAIVKSAQDIK
jgi:hypothetical protein